MVQDKDRIAVLQANGFAGVTKQTISIARNPDRFALCLIPRADKLLRLAFPNDPLIPGELKDAKESRPQDPTVRCKISEARKAELIQALREDGYNEIQSGLAFVIEMYLIKRRRDEDDIQQAG